MDKEERRGGVCLMGRAGRVHRVRLYSSGAVRERMATLRTDAPHRRDQLPITLAEQ
jgi:hypothetical protein